MVKRSFLLGAGASIDAGLPSSVGLTKSIAGHLGQGHSSGVGQLLHAVIGALIRHDSSNGGDAFVTPDVERVFSAVRDLRRRDSLDVSAFVERWDSGLDMVTGPKGLDWQWGESFRDALLGERADSFELRQVFERGVMSMTESRSWEMLDELEHRMLEALIKLLQVNPSLLGYLYPILQSRDLSGIATLNYDLNVETAASQLGLTVSTGLNQWRGGFGWQWEPGVDIRLLKLHGSLDYALHEARPTGRRMRTEHLVPTNGENPANPALVFGVNSKLRSDGPFLAMLIEFDRLLSETEWLVVVGYSFRDAHINAGITRWANSEISRRLTIIDPSTERWTEVPHAGGYAGSLIAAASGSGVEHGRDMTWPRLEVDLLPATAADGLAQLLP